MKFRKVLALLLTLSMLAGLAVSASAAIVTDDSGNYFYEPTEQGIYSDGGYTLEKISHPQAGPGQTDGILEGELQDRGQSYSWSMAEAGDYIYIGTCYNSTFFIYHDNIKTTLTQAQKKGIINPDVDVDKVAEQIVGALFGVDTFDPSRMNEWEAVIIAVNKYTGQSQLIFNERDHWEDLDENGKPMFLPMPGARNFLSGYRMVTEYHGKLYFAGMGNPTATLVEVDPATNEAQIVYHNIRIPKKSGSYDNVANGVHGLMVYDDEILMCLAVDDYDSETPGDQPGGVIVASGNPGAGLDQWRILADQSDFDDLPAIMQSDGLNGGGIWDIIEFNGHLYVTVVTDKNIDGRINKQGFAMYRGDKNASGDMEWVQIVGDHGTSGYGFGMGINYAMSCNLWVYDDHLYMGTYNDPMLDLAAVPATGDFELLYHDLDHSIYLYRMDENENFQQIGGKNDNPNFPDGPIGNLGAGLGSNSNQYVWRMGIHNDELYIGTYDTSTLSYMFTQPVDGQLVTMDKEDLQARADILRDSLLKVLQQEDNKALDWLLGSTVFSQPVLDFLQNVSGFFTEKFDGQNPVPEYEKNLEAYEAYKDKVMYLLLANVPVVLSEEPVDFAAFYGADVPAVLREGDPQGIRDYYVKAVKDFFALTDKIFYDNVVHNFAYYLGVNYYAQQAERGFDLLVSNDGVNFDAITRDGFGDGENHGLRTICSTNVGVFMGTANPFHGTQLWLMSSDRDESRLPDLPFVDVNRGDWFFDAVHYVYDNYLFAGVSSTEFGPYMSMDRGMMVQILYRLAGQPAVSGSLPFEDVPAGAYYEKALLWAVQNGITTGVSETGFAPKEAVTRAQMVTMLYRYGQLTGADMSVSGDLSAFADAETVPAFAREPMIWATQNGLIAGNAENLLNPYAPATRAQAAMMLQRCAR